MAATLTSVNAALKRSYPQSTVQELLFQETATLDKIDKTPKYTYGEVARVPLHVSRNGGYTALPDGGGNLNTAGNQGLNKTDYTYTNHHQQVAVQGDVLDRTSQSINSIVNAVTLEVDGAITDLRRQLQRQIFMNGDALIAQCRASATNNVDLNTVSGANAIARGWLFVNQPVDVGTTANEVAIVDGGVITAIDETNVAVTVSSGNIAGEGTTHYISHQNSRSGTTSYEMYGLPNLAATSGTVGTLATSSEPRWRGAGSDSTSQPLTVSLLLQAQQAIAQRTGKKADTIITGLKQERKLYEQLQLQERYTSDSINVGNSSSVRFQNMALEVDPDCPDTDLYLLRLKALFMVAIDKPYWQNKVTGGDILSWIQGTDSYGAKLTYRANLATNDRQSLYRFSGLS